LSKAVGELDGEAFAGKLLTTALPSRRSMTVCCCREGWLLYFFPDEFCFVLGLPLVGVFFCST